MEVHYVKGNRSRSDLQVSVFQWEDKVTDTENKRKVCGKWAHREEVHTWYKFPRDAEMPLVTDLKFIYFSSNLFCICL